MIRVTRTLLSKRPAFRRVEEMVVGIFVHSGFSLSTLVLLSLCSALFGQLASAASEGSPISPTSPTSFVPGQAFDRFVIITLENTDYDSAARDHDFQALESQAILLDRYYALTHPSQANYVGSVGGDYFGLNVDNPINIPSNVSSIVDLLEDRGVSWGAYLESMPYTGFTGEAADSLYYRKHNPLVSFQSVAANETRMAHIKNLSMFYTDLDNDSLPQWMYISPNINNDGHDTGVTFASNWTRTFLSNVLDNSKFNNNTCVLLTFDENEIYPLENRVYSLLLGNAIPSNLTGTNDSTFYTHYSQLSTVQANWGLYNLGRQDTNKSVANVFDFVAKITNYTNLQMTEYPLNNVSEGGVFNNHSYLWSPIPSPNLTAQGAGGPILPILTTQINTQTQSSRARDVVSGSVVFSLLIAGLGAWYLGR